MDADLTRLFDNLKSRLPGAVDSQIKLELFSVLNDFFQNTNIWRENLEVLTQPDVQEYLIVPSGVSTINRLMWVYDSKGFPVDANMPIPGELHLYFKPNTSDTITATVALTVTDPTTRDDIPVFPDWILNKYNTVIQDGVLARMMSQIAKPYSNQQMALYHGREYKQGTSFAKVETQRNNLYRGQSWRFPQSFNRRRYVKL